MYREGLDRKSHKLGFKVALYAFHPYYPSYPGSLIAPYKLEVVEKGQLTPAWKE